MADEGFIDHAGAAALRMLQEGNARYAAEMSEGPRRDLLRRQQLRESQNPFAIVVACADSRVSPELVFDQGLGDLFVVRVAGNVVDPAGLGSLEFAVEALGVPLLVMVGHTGCGAVLGATSGDWGSGYWGEVLAAVRPAVDEARGLTGDLHVNAVRANVRLSLERVLRESSVLRSAVSGGQLIATGAVYDVGSGLVEWLGPRVGPVC